ncbi:MAG: carbon storage regulator CsrA [Cyanobacteria bacterium SZAS LIN-2]|nr:carbon storage regulator CsrA [Cyanobacteria bacterium SZAS LIN-2]
MLILTRRLGETVRIGEDITVTVLGYSGNQVRLGFGAPRNVHIVREELVDRIEQSKSVSSRVGLSGRGHQA